MSKRIDLVAALRLHASDDCGGAHVPTHVCNLAADEIERLRAALTEIAHPLAALRARAEREGCRLSAMALQVVDHPEHGRSIARRAIGDDRGDDDD